LENCQEINKIEKTRLIVRLSIGVIGLLVIYSMMMVFYYGKNDGKGDRKQATVQVEYVDYRG
jgi:hypothetical protein